MTGQVISKVMAGDGSTNLVSNSFSGSGVFDKEENKLKITLFDSSVTSLTLIDGMTLNVVILNWEEEYEISDSPYQVEIYTANGRTQLNLEEQFLIYRDIAVTNRRTPIFDIDITRGFSIVYHNENWHILEGIDLNDCSAIDIIDKPVIDSINFQQGVISSLRVEQKSGSSYSKLVWNTGSVPSLSSNSVTVSHTVRKNDETGG